MSTNPASRSAPSRAPGPSSKTSNLTRLNQDRQARNKEPDDDDDDDENGSSDEGIRRGNYDLFGNESYASVITRREAIAVLDNPELLMMHAQARNDSIPSTRLHFLKLLSGKPLTEAQEFEASERRLAQLKRLAKKRELVEAGMVEADAGSSSRDGGAAV
ncbi:hypothetical protein DSL72_006396 [Monilinia vaccinii-corymbosi]|uniref:Uncharacterized protein n=1 Tax=Monilinia vaccinii-corymbosi TaxID=61207 RepID=A0A8A3PNW9_9HELO|nr:hypothetical protein DSL72_006396 [Monilinia vaccinii-corymbosi]